MVAIFQVVFISDYYLLICAHAWRRFSGDNCAGSYLSPIEIPGPDSMHLLFFGSQRCAFSFQNPSNKRIYSHTLELPIEAPSFPNPDVDDTNHKSYKKLDSE